MHSSRSPRLKLVLTSGLSLLLGVAASPDALAGVLLPTSVTAVIDAPANGSTVSLDGLTEVVLQGHVVTVGVAPQALVCNWYVDDVLRASQPFTVAGRCDAPIPAATLLPRTHVFKLEAVRPAPLLIVSTTSTASFTTSPTVVAGRDKTCGGMDGEFHIRGKVNGTDGSSGLLTLTAEDSSGTVEFLQGASTTESLETSALVHCTAPGPGARCEGGFEFDLQLADPTGHPGPIQWTVDADVSVLTSDGTEVETYSSYTSTGPQDLRVVVPPVISFQEVLDGVSGAVTDQAAWGNSAGHPLYTFTGSYPASIGLEAFWGDATFEASAVCEDGSTTTTSLECTRSNVPDGSGGSFSSYACSVSTTGLCVAATADYLPWTIALVATDDEGISCSADDTLELDMYADDGLVDYDRDGADVTNDGDCDDEDATSWPGNPDPDICDDAADNNCDGTINDAMLDEFDAAARNDTIDSATGPTNISGSELFEGSFNEPGDVDWYFVHFAADTGRVNLTFTAEVDISAACDAGATGEFVVSVQVAEDGLLSHTADGVYSAGADGERGDPFEGSTDGATSTLTCSAPAVSLSFLSNMANTNETLWWIGIENTPSSADWAYGVCATEPAATAPQAAYSIEIVE